MEATPFSLACRRRAQRLVEVERPGIKVSRLQPPPVASSTSTIGATPSFMVTAQWLGPTHATQTGAQRPACPSGYPQKVLLGQLALPGLIRALQNALCADESSYLPSSWPYMVKPGRSNSSNCSTVAQAGTRLALASSARGASGWVLNTPVACRCEQRLVVLKRKRRLRTMASGSPVTPLPFPRHHTQSAHRFSATSGSGCSSTCAARLLPAHEICVPRRTDDSAFADSHCRLPLVQRRLQARFSIARAGKARL